MRVEPFSPEVKTFKIEQFLETPKLTKMPGHRAAFRTAETMYKRWVRDQQGKDALGKATVHYGTCPCGYVYEHSQDRYQGHGLTCIFSPTYPGDENSPQGWVNITANGYRRRPDKQLSGQHAD